MRSRSPRPNHWHALGAIWAASGGPRMFMSRSPLRTMSGKARKMVEAARKYNRIIQVGTQCRSSVGLQEAIAWLREGQLGKNRSRHAGLCYKRREKHRQNHRPAAGFPANGQLRSVVRPPRRSTRRAAIARRTAPSTTTGIGSGLTATATIGNPGHPSDGHRAMGAGRAGDFTARSQPRRTAGL